MKKVLTCLALLTLLFCFISCAGEEVKEESEEEAAARREAKIEALIRSAGVDSVTFEVGEIEQFRYGASALITAEVPNYSEMFKAAFAEKNPEKAFSRMISKKEYTTVSYEGYANVTYENDEPIVHSDEIIKTFIDRELVRAINEVLAGEEAAE